MQGTWRCYLLCNRPWVPLRCGGLRMFYLSAGDVIIYTAWSPGLFRTKVPGPACLLRDTHPSAVATVSVLLGRGTFRQTYTVKAADGAVSVLLINHGSDLNLTSLTAPKHLSLTQLYHNFRLPVL